MVASTFTHDRGVAGSRQDLLHVLPVAGSDKVWYLNATRAGLLHGVWEPPQRVQPQHDRARRLAHTGSRRQLFHPSWWPRGQGDCYAKTATLTNCNLIRIRCLRSAAPSSPSCSLRLRFLIVARTATGGFFNTLPKCQSSASVPDRNPRRLWRVDVRGR